MRDDTGIDSDAHSMWSLAVAEERMKLGHWLGLVLHFQYFKTDVQVAGSTAHFSNVRSFAPEQLKKVYLGRN